jgi:hypothetical protein
MNITDTKHYYLTPSGGTKLNGFYNSKIKFDIPYFITFNKNIIYQTLKISHCEIPYSFYIINDTNNYIKINNIGLYIENGNYNAYTLMDKLNELMTENSINGLFILDTSTGKYILSSSSPISINSSTIYKIIGIDNASYIGIFDNTTLKYYIYCHYPVNTGGIRNIYIKTNLITSNLNLNNNDSSIIKSIPINVPPFGIIMYSNTENIESFIKNRETDYLEIQLIDDDNNLINFNNLEWTICLELKITKQFIINNLNLDDYFENKK